MSLARKKNEFEKVRVKSENAKIKGIEVIL